MLSGVVEAGEAEGETPPGIIRIIVAEGAGFTVATRTAREQMLYLQACLSQISRVNTAPAFQILQLGTRAVIISKAAPTTSFKQLYKQQIGL